MLRVPQLHQLLDLGSRPIVVVAVLDLQESGGSTIICIAADGRAVCGGCTRAGLGGDVAVIVSAMTSKPRP